MARGNVAPWDSIGGTGNGRARERTGRLSFGGKGKRQTVTANGVTVVQRTDAQWFETDDARKAKLAPQAATHYGTGATVRDAERARGMDLPDSAKLAGQRMQSGPDETRTVGDIDSPKLFGGYYGRDSQRYIGRQLQAPSDKFAGGLRYAPKRGVTVASHRVSVDGGTDKAIAYFVAPSHVVTPADQYRIFKSRPDPRDRIAREMVAADASHGKRSENEAKRRKAQAKKLRAMLAG